MGLPRPRRSLRPRARDRRGACRRMVPTLVRGATCSRDPGDARVAARAALTRRRPPGGRRGHRRGDGDRSRAAACAGSLARVLEGPGADVDHRGGPVGVPLGHRRRGNCALRRGDRRDARGRAAHRPGRALVDARRACPARAGRVPDVRGDAPRSPRVRRRARPDLRRPRLGARARLSGDGRRLARDEPVRVAVLASPRLPPDLPAALPLDTLIRAFEDEHVEAATALLADRHRRHCAAEPLLTEVDLGARIEALRGLEGASGWVAVERDEVVGYLIGTPRSDEIWGRNVWVEAAGHAARDPEVVRDLYGVAAGHWVEESNTRHSVLVPASDTGLIDAWWRLSFGHQHSHGIQELPESVDVSVPEGFEIRDPDLAEIEALIDLDLALPEHQRQSPVFGGRNSYSREESRAEWMKTLAEGDEEILIGAYRGRPVACWALVPIARSNENRELFQPEDACFLGFAVTLPEARGFGIGVTLPNASLTWARDDGYGSLATDWRETNLLASRFWPARGFRRTFLRLYRSIP